VRRGTFYLGKPIGRRCAFKYGGDLIIITQNGAFPMSSVLQSAAIEPKLAVTNKIENAFIKASNLYKGNVGWEVIFYPAQSALIFNIPTATGTESIQYVLNTSSPKKPWCEFSGWNATCFALFNNELYYGLGTAVQKAWTTMADDGLNIVAEYKRGIPKIRPAASKKRATLYRPILQVDGSINYLTGIDVDFRDTPILGEATYTVTSGAVWDSSTWDDAYWAASLDIVRQWSSPQENIGTWFAGKLKVSTNRLEVHMLASDIMFEGGGWDMSLRLFRARAEKGFNRTVTAPSGGSVLRGDASLLLNAVAQRRIFEAKPFAVRPIPIYGVLRALLLRWLSYATRQKQDQKKIFHGNLR
jgi:hypothetical protein